MNRLSANIIAGFAALMLAQSVAAIADPSAISINGGSAAPVETVQTEIGKFANRFGEPVILHGPLNLAAPISLAANSSVTSDEEISILAQAADGTAQRVYFVMPARGDAYTDKQAAAKLVDNKGGVSVNLNRVSAVAAIKAVAAADNADVRFPDGAPLGTVTFRSENLPLELAIARVAAQTHTRWSLGYIVASSRPLLPALAANDVYVNPGSEIYLPTTSGDSTVGGVASSTSAGNGNDSAVATTTSGDSTVGGVAAIVPVPGSGNEVGALTPNKPLPRDAAGNILPFYIHVPTLPNSATAAGSPTMTPAQQAAAARLAALAEAQQQQQAQQYNGFYPGIASDGQPMSVYDPTVQTFPGDGLFGGPTEANQTYLGSDFGSVSTIVPGGNESGFQLVPGYGW